MVSRIVVGLLVLSWVTVAMVIVAVEILRRRTPQQPAAEV
jgi:hypothetical protein